MAAPDKDHFVLKNPSDFDAFEAEVTIALEEEQVLGWVKDAEYIKLPPWRAPPLMGGRMMGSEQDEARAVKWQASDAKARRILLDHLDTVYRVEFRSCRTARALWQSLESRIRSHTARSISAALATYSALAIGSDETLDNYIKRFESAVDNLEASIAQERFSPIDRRLHALHFINGLQCNDWYPKFIAAQLSKRPQELHYEALRFDVYSPQWFEGLTATQSTTVNGARQSATKNTSFDRTEPGPRVLDYDHKDSDCFVHPNQGHKNSQCVDQDATRKKGRRARYQDPGLLGAHHATAGPTRPYRTAAKGGGGRDQQRVGAHGGLYKNDAYRTGAASVTSASGSSSEQTEQAFSTRDSGNERHSRAQSVASEGTDLIDVGDTQSISGSSSRNK